MKILRYGIVFIFLLLLILLIKVMVIKEEPPLTTLEESKFDILEPLNVKIVASDDVTEKWSTYTDDTGISFKYDSKIWEANISRDLECNSFSQNKSYCIEISQKNSSNLVKIKMENLPENENVGGGIITSSYYNSAKIIELSNVTLLRGDKVSNDYFDRANVELGIVTELYELPKTIDSGLIAYGIDTGWLVKGSIGYTFTYLIDPSLIPDRNNIGENEVVDTMDQIMSTLEIDFEAMPF